MRRPPPTNSDASHHHNTIATRQIPFTGGKQSPPFTWWGKQKCNPQLTDTSCDQEEEQHSHGGGMCVFFPQAGCCSSNGGFFGDIFGLRNMDLLIKAVCAAAFKC